MRFCPFCAQENPDDAHECVHCGKRLPASRQVAIKPMARPPAPPQRPAPPRPGPRALTPAPPPDPLAPTVQPNTLPAPPSPRRLPEEATLKPLADVKPAAARPISDSEMVTVARAPAAPTGTLLGLPAQELPSSLTPAASGEHADGRRVTQPLSPRGASFDEEGATEVHGAATTLDESTTSPTPRLDDALDDAETGARPLPPPRARDRRPPTPAEGSPAARPLHPTPAQGSPAARAATPAQAQGTPAPRKPTPAQGSPARKPTPAQGSPARKPTPAQGAAAPLPPDEASTPVDGSPAPRATTATLPGKTSATLSSSREPAPLPPPPAGPAPVSNDAGAFPHLDAGPTPALPTLALPPMPEHPRSASVLDAVRYLLPLAKAIWARKRAQDAIRTLLHGDQRLLDGVLRDLGRVAREEQLPVPALADEMRRVQEQETRRADADRAASEAEAAGQREEERWRIDLGERQADSARREGEIAALDGELRQKSEERRLHEVERARVDGEIRSAEKRASAADAKAAKADSLPPEKGGGPNSAANARAEATAARHQAGALAPARDSAAAAAAALDEPIATLTAKLGDARTALQQKKRETTEAARAHEQTLDDLQRERERAIAERDAAERELTQRFVTAGTILNLNRVDHPKLTPLFARVDELKNAVNAREAAMLRLESERRLYDRPAVQKGLLTVGIAAGVLVLLAIVLIVFLARAK